MVMYIMTCMTLFGPFRGCTAPRCADDVHRARLGAFLDFCGRRAIFLLATIWENARVAAAECSVRHMRIRV